MNNSTMKNRVGRIHFVGIGGTGMCGIAEVLHTLGYTVSGSDIADNAACMHLRQIGVQIFHGHTADNIKGAQVVVISTAIKNNNPEVISAIEARIPVIPRAIMLAELMRFQDGIAIAGTHGKTTTTSLTASILGAAGLDPTYVIGGRLNASGSNARLGQGKYIVAEADESDASFLYLTPLFSVITNIDKDHMDTYDHKEENLHQAFIDFVHRMPFYGKSFICLENKHCRAILPQIKKPFATYGWTDEADFYADKVKAVGTQMHFTVHAQRLDIEFDVMLNCAGKHNVLNALAAISVALECGVSIESIQEGLRHFDGVGRRFQSYGEITLPSGGNALVIDDYGHHPEEMRATLEAARSAYPDRRLVLAFQPHRYSRTRDLFEGFVAILSTADALILTEVYPAGEDPIVEADSKSLARAISTLSEIEPVFEPDISRLPDVIYHSLKEGDVLLNMGAGSINKVPEALVKLSKKQ